jgi:hypothetical protein
MARTRSGRKAAARHPARRPAKLRQTAPARAPARALTFHDLPLAMLVRIFGLLADPDAARRVLPLVCRRWAAALR